MKSPTWHIAFLAALTHGVEAVVQSTLTPRSSVSTPFLLPTPGPSFAAELVRRQESDSVDSTESGCSLWISADENSQIACNPGQTCIQTSFSLACCSNLTCDIPAKNCQDYTTSYSNFGSTSLFSDAGIVWNTGTRTCSDSAYPYCNWLYGWDETSSIILYAYCDTERQVVPVYAYGSTTDSPTTTDIIELTASETQTRTSSSSVPSDLTNAAPNAPFNGTSAAVAPNNTPYIIGGAVGGILGLAAIAAAFFLLWRKWAPIGSNRSRKSASEPSKPSFSLFSARGPVEQPATNEHPMTVSKIDSAAQRAPASLVHEASNSSLPDNIGRNLQSPNVLDHVSMHSRAATVSPRPMQHHSNNELFHSIPPQEMQSETWLGSRPSTPSASVSRGVSSRFSEGHLSAQMGSQSGPIPDWK